MDAVKFIKTQDRMCKSYPCCFDCPLAVQKNKMGVTCNEYIKTCPEEAVAVVEKWLIKHPAKTMLEDFLEKYPNALFHEDGSPKCCCESLGYVKDSRCWETDCVECWNRPLE